MSYRNQAKQKFVISILLCIIIFLLILNESIDVDMRVQENNNLPHSSEDFLWTPNGSAISTEINEQHAPRLISDSSGGAIITWADNRSGNKWDIYTQKINSSGSTQWTINGTPICTEINEQITPKLVGDGSGGAIITWRDNRSGTYDVYIQKINSSGSIQWNTNGTIICNAISHQGSPQIISDGAGGAIITWSDKRSGSDWDLYAQKINSSGVIQWIINGTEICTASSYSVKPSLVSDGAGGAIITWRDYRSGSNYDIYSQKINSTGIVQWTVNGVNICVATGHQNDPQIVNDDMGGAIITWMDERFGASNDDIFAQRINSAGVVQWTANGVAISVAADFQRDPFLISDGSGGAIITWFDNRDTNGYDIYAQKINSAGLVQWTANGVGICTGTNFNWEPQLVTDGAGGAIFTWRDDRNDISDIYAQKINSAGLVQWTTDGVAICTATNFQIEHQLVSDGAGGAIFTWSDPRNGDLQDDIYAQKIADPSSGIGNPDENGTPDEDNPQIISGYILIVFFVFSIISVIIAVEKKKFKF